jgi:hypothetical protein
LIEAFAIERARPSDAASSKRHLVVVPPVCGLAHPLDKTLRSLAASLARDHGCVQVVEFPGQNGRVGYYSVANSCDHLENHLAMLPPEQGVQLLGLCSGAIACFHAALQCARVTHVLAWEVSPQYCYDRAHRTYCERRFGVRFCERSWLTPIQPITLVPRLKCQVAFACGVASRYSNEKGQQELVELAMKGTRLTVLGLGHFLCESEPRQTLASEFLAWSGEQAGFRQATGRDGSHKQW